MNGSLFEKFQGKIFLIRDATGKDYRGKAMYSDGEWTFLADGEGVTIKLRTKAVVSVIGPFPDAV